MTKIDLQEELDCYADLQALEWNEEHIEERNKVCKELKDHFRSCNIKHADVMTGPDGRSKGCGLVTFDSVQDAIRAVREKDNTFLAGRKISVREDRIN